MPQFPPQDSPPIVPKDLVSMSHEGGNDNMTEDEKAFMKAFFDMIEMVKVLYEERNSRLQGEGSKPPKGKGSLGGRGNGSGDKPPSTPPSSSHHIHLQLHPLPLLQPLLILMNLPQKELVNNPC